MSGCLSSTSEWYAFSRVDPWRTHMIKKHGLSREEVQTIVKEAFQWRKKKAGEVDTDEA